MVDAARLRRYPVMDVSLDFATIRQKLSSSQAKRQQRINVERQAAVAVILRPSQKDAGDTEVLLIKRADRPGDPWSGHMAFPGGHKEPYDLELRATAMRETLEEVGLDLHQHDYLGALDEIPAMARGQFLGMLIAPHVFALRHDDVDLQPNAEVAELMWVPLGQLMRGDVDAIKELMYDGEPRSLPAFKVQEYLVWGMTHSMLQSLFTVLRTS
jgi:8-oxo-dGTP pyrophosphatase MutT (NUDIX family)